MQMEQNEGKEIEVFFPPISCCFRALFPLFFGGGVELNWVRMMMMMNDDECGAICGMLGMEIRSIRRKPTPVPLFPSQISHTWPGLEPGPPLWEAGGFSVLGFLF
jgi:hypothetical protein